MGPKLFDVLTVQGRITRGRVNFMTWGCNDKYTIHRIRTSKILLNKQSESVDIAYSDCKNYLKLSSSV